MIKDTMNFICCLLLSCGADRRVHGNDDRVEAT
jgi:hypothetical protein